MPPVRVAVQGLAQQPMKITMDKILAEYADQFFEAARLGRNDTRPARDRVSAEMLIELEAAGDAMRYLDPCGQIAWKATPSLCQHLKGHGT